MFKDCPKVARAPDTYRLATGHQKAVGAKGLGVWGFRWVRVEGFRSVWFWVLVFRVPKQTKHGNVAICRIRICSEGGNAQVQQTEHGVAETRCNPEPRPTERERERDDDTLKEERKKRKDASTE